MRFGPSPGRGAATHSPFGSASAPCGVTGNYAGRTQGSASLDALLGSVDLSASLSPQYHSSERPAVEPEYPEAGSPFTVTYAAFNYGTDAPAECTDAVRMLDVQQNVVAEEPGAGISLAAGGSESMEMNITSGVPTEGRYTIRVWINLGGAAERAPANAPGTQTLTDTSLLVGIYERAKPARRRRAPRSDGRQPYC